MDLRPSAPVWSYGEQFHDRVSDSQWHIKAQVSSKGGIKVLYDGKATVLPCVARQRYLQTNSKPNGTSDPGL